MRGLLFKDLCGLRQIGKQTLVVLAVFFAWCMFMKNTQMFSMMIIIYTMMLVLTAMSYDETAGFDKYALTLPVTRNELVKTKYVLLLILFGTGVLLGILGGMILRMILVSGTDVWEETISTTAAAFLYLLAFEIMLPLIFRFGVEKARLFLAVIFLAAFGLLYGGKIFGGMITGQMAAGGAAAGVFAVFAGVPISYLISARIVQKREW